MKRPHFNTAVNLCLLAGITLSSPLFNPVFATENRQSLEEIRTAAVNFMTAEYEGMDDFEVHAGRLDKRLRLNTCNKPLQAFWPQSAGRHTNSTVGIRCSGPKPWRLYVPVKVAIYKDILVTARPLPKDTVISQDDIMLQRRDVSRLIKSYIQDSTRLIGYHSKQAWRSGQVITTHMVKAPVTIKRGETVTILASGPHMDIRMAGKALSDGAAGDTIQIRNISTKRTVEGVVVKSGLVKVRL